MGHGITRKDIVLHKNSTAWHGLAENLGDVFTVDDVFARPAFKFDLALGGCALVLPEALLSGDAHAERIAALAKTFGLDPDAEHPDAVLDLLAALSKYETIDGDRYSIRVNDDGSYHKYGKPVTDAYTHFTQVDARSTWMELEKTLGAIFKLSSAGTLNMGARCWLQANLEDQGFEIETKLGTKFPHSARFTFMWGHDGRTPVLFLGNDTDIVCENTSEFALNENKGRISIPHTSGVHDAVEAAVKMIADLPGAIDENRRVLQEMAGAECTVGEFRKFAEAIALGVTEYASIDERDEKVAKLIMEKRPIADGGQAKTSRALTLFENTVEEYVAEFERRATGYGKREPGAGYTLYAADSAISARIDHPTGVQDALSEIQAAGGVEAYVKASKAKYAEAVSTINRVSRAAESSLSGAGAEVKRRARMMLLRSGGIVKK